MIAQQARLSVMLVETLSDELLEGWTKLGVFALIVAFVFGLVFLLMRISSLKERSPGHKRRVTGLNRKQRRQEQASKRKRGGR